MNKNIEWLNSNSQRNYPLKENVSRIDNTGNFTIPNELFLDAVFVTNINNDFFVKKIMFFDSIIVINIHDKNDEFVSTTSVNVSTHTENDSYIIQGQGVYSNLQGKFVLGNLVNVSAMALGSYEFTIETAKLEDTVVIPSIRGVDSITNEDVSLVGDVEIKEGFNVRIRVDEAENCIFIDAIDGEGLGPFCPCEEDTFVGDPIFTINGIPPDGSNNFNIRGIDCIEVQGVQGGIEIENTCQEVCCDCDIGDDLDALQEQIAALELKVSDLSARVDSFHP